jgi:hypothetical protein
MEAKKSAPSRRPTDVRSGGSHKNGMARRGIKDIRTYQRWVGCKKNPAVTEDSKLTGLLHHSADYINDGKKGEELKDHCAALWKVLGRVHRRVFKREGGVYERYGFEDMGTPDDLLIIERREGGKARP